MSSYLTKISCIALLGVVATNANAGSVQSNILTGGPSGTYIQVGKDISEISKPYGLNLNVHTSSGSLENIYGVFKRPQTQFGIVQSDVLDFLRTFEKDDPEIRKIVSQTRIAFPLYNEEIHVVARPEIESLKDLEGKRVGVGKKDSGTNLTATFILDAGDLKIGEAKNMGAKDALDALLANELDAFFYVVGAPASLLEDDRLTKDNIKLLPVKDAALQAYYPKATIPANTYPWQTEAVDGITVKAVLMTYEFSSNNSAYFKQSCDIVAKYSYVINAELENLKETGHPKWKQVDFSQTPPGWKRGSCVEKGLSSDFVLKKAEAGVDPVKLKACDAETNPVSKRLCQMKAKTN